MNKPTITQFSTRLNIREIRNLAKQFSTQELLLLITEGDKIVARNAAWALTHKTDKEVQSIPQQELVHIILESDYEWVQRMLLSVVERQSITKEFSTDLLDFCLFRMVNPDYPCGIQALCLKLAYRMSRYYPELAHEFDQVVQMAQHIDFKPGMAHLLKKLNSGKSL